MTEPTVTYIWEQLHDALRSFIAKRVSNDAEIQDILQDVFVRVHHRLNSLQEQKRMVPWVYQITRNAIIDHYRSAERRREIPVGLATDVTKEMREGSFESDDPEVKHELALCLRPMIDRLPGEYRKAITLVELDGLTQHAAAMRLGISLPSIKSRVLRGRRQLRKMLSQCCLIELDSRKGVAHYERRSSDCSCESPHLGVGSQRTDGNNDTAVDWTRDDKTGK